MAKNPGTVAYQAYYDYFNGKDPNGPDDSEWDMEGWEDLDEEQRKAWFAAATSVLKELLPIYDYLKQTNE